MIQFQWELISDNRFQIRIRTPQTLVGTLHRLCVAMYVMGLNVISGNVLTEEEDGVAFTHDNFVLKTPDRPETHFSINESTARLGALMESVLHPSSDPDALLGEHNVTPPNPEVIFALPHKIDFSSAAGSGLTRMYIETPDRRGLLLHITRILARMDINIWNAVILTTDTGIAEDTLYLQYDGQMLSVAMQNQLRERLEHGF